MVVFPAGAFGAATPATTIYTSKNHHSIGYNFGVGYDFNKNLGAQIVYNLHNHKSTALTYTF
jgi:hypothetical protein